MTRPIRQGWMYGWRAGRGDESVREADYAFRAEDILDVSINERVNELKDQASVSVTNVDGVYTNENVSNDAVIRHGDRVSFYTGGGSVTYGSGEYGEGPYAPTLDHQWTGIVRNLSVNAEGADIYRLEFDVEDFPYAVMSMRNVTNAWEDRKILSGPGSGSGIINTMLANNAPEIDLSQLPNLSQTASVSFNSRNLMEAVVALASQAKLIVRSDKTALRFEEPSSLQTQFTLQHDDYSLWSYSSNDDELFNDVRLNGGRGHEVDEKSSQPRMNGQMTVTDTSRGLVRVTSRKGEVDRAEIFTYPQDTESDDDLTLRLQVNDGGEPINIDDTKSDIASKTLDHDFLAEGGWTTFNIPQHDLPSPNPWIIIESGGNGGQTIGVYEQAGGGTQIAMKLHYPYNVTTQRINSNSVDKYRRREDTIKDNSIEVFDAARDEIRAYLRRHSEPDTEFSFDNVQSDRMHNLDVGEIVRVNMPHVSESGRYVCIQKQTTWQTTQEEVNLTFRDLESL